MRTVAICSGEDWYDASFELIRVPDDLSIREASQEYKDWLRAKVEVEPCLERYLTFVEWLRKNKGASDSGIEEFWHP